MRSFTDVQHLQDRLQLVSLDHDFLVQFWADEAFHVFGLEIFDSRLERRGCRRHPRPDVPGVRVFVCAEVTVIRSLLVAVARIHVALTKRLQKLSCDGILAEELDSAFNLRNLRGLVGHGVEQAACHFAEERSKEKDNLKSET